ncbi:hypothetical protein EYF80_002890 [Liparis tanakae]|uniref:Uncharacterized protein n=1 Tax=Liparis tanakae TaxID=230148 RepID=A0A4Z2J9I8_9TELE|nr:hypothetical protein EYF80_002890 [Liparis tanakae]
MQTQTSGALRRRTEEELRNALPLGERPALKRSGDPEPMALFLKKALMFAVDKYPVNVGELSATELPRETATTPSSTRPSASQTDRGTSGWRQTPGRRSTLRRLTRLQLISERRSTGEISGRHNHYYDNH